MHVFFDVQLQRFLDRHAVEEVEHRPVLDRADQPAHRFGVDILGAAYLGGSPLSPYVLAGRIDELTPGSVARLERGLRTARAPWATTGF